MVPSNSITSTRPNEPSVSVVVEVADRKGVDPIELTPPLHQVVDPDALDALVAGPDARDPTMVVTFDYQGYHVEIRGDGSIDVRDDERIDDRV